MVLLNKKKSRKAHLDAEAASSSSENEAQTSTSTGKGRSLSDDNPKAKALLQIDEEASKYSHTITTSGRQGPPAGYNSWTDMIKHKGIPPQELNPADLDIQARIRSEKKVTPLGRFVEALAQERNAPTRINSRA